MNTRQHAASGLRLALLILFILLQLSALAGVLLFFQKKFTWFYAACEVLSFLAALYILQEDENPSYKIPWILVTLLLPLLGGPAYLLYGRVHPSRAERRREAALIEQLDKASTHLPETACDVPPEMERQVDYLRRVAEAPVYANTQVEYFPEGDAFFAALLRELLTAERFIFLEYYIIHPGKLWDSVLEILKEKARQGVDVRVAFDAVGCIETLPPGFPAQMELAGIACCAFNRFNSLLSARFNNRDHRKICVIDGRVGFTGGINLADEYANLITRFGHWKDTAVLLRGEAVWSLTTAFLTMWGLMRDVHEDFRLYLPPSDCPPAPGLVQPFADTPRDQEPVGLTAYCNMLAAARRYVWITTPYLVPDHVLVTALTTAAKSGVDVRIVTPGVPDKKLVYRLTRSYYPVLLRAGVRIFEYTPGFLHAKQFLSDDRCAIVGTINLDYRSLCHHYECAAWMCDVPALADIRADFEQLFPQCREITPELSRRQSRGHRLLVAVLSIFSPML